jgi:hypothetical protein
MMCSCKAPAPFKIRGIDLCHEHYIEALEHSADFTFDATELGKMYRLPPNLERKRVLSKAAIDREVALANKAARKRRGEL